MTTFIQNASHKQYDINVLSKNQESHGELTREQILWHLSYSLFCFVFTVFLIRGLLIVFRDPPHGNI